jgi:hypothetical protein
VERFHLIIVRTLIQKKNLLVFIRLSNILLLK